ncbi:DUF6656 family protein [Neorhizobium alkalisoli]|jgi:hypothetical protein|uniref:Uncharacterized protein n=1 Tax=Neorhizobium alkalisoli TaxID=528178 RepID=A0A561R3U4_9HYPH|nr:DUF6656 family protein [Neorhizobium alkalisoli]TWF57253.1 hypothetical protein FHW37_102896 [Neorhizobium alkalisoli]
MQTTGKLRYYEATKRRPFGALTSKTTAHSEFLRTGRISRSDPIWMPSERRYLSYEEVAERTGKKLDAAGEKTHERINGFHHSIQFPKIVFHRTLDQSPHLGYCHVTSASTLFTSSSPVTWSFYLANFFSEIGEEEQFFRRIDARISRMYFAVATEKADDQQMRINRSIRGNGLLFQTSDPHEAMRNVLMLGAPDDAIRAIIKRL